MLLGTVGLKTHIWNNNLRSIFLIALYPFMIGAMFWVIAALFGGLVVYGNTGNEGFAAHQSAAFANQMLYAYWPLIFSIVGIWFIIAYFFQTKMIRMLSRAHPVTRQEEPELYNMLENLSIAAGLPMPRLEIIETHARNAFASGIDKNSFSVTVTRGLLQSLKKDEVEAVLAHEMTHILNRDVRLLIVSIIFTGMIGFAAQLVWNSVRFSAYSRGRRDGRIVLFIFIVAAILWLGYIATMFTRFALSRRREYMADAGAIELTKNPEAMMRALMRIAGKDRIPHASGDIALMCIENRQPFMGLFSTHPPIDERIKIIAETTGTPIPDITEGYRAGDSERFQNPHEEAPRSWASLAAKKPIAKASAPKPSRNKNPWG